MWNPCSNWGFHFIIRIMLVLSFLAMVRSFGRDQLTRLIELISTYATLLNIILLLLLQKIKNRARSAARGNLIRTDAAGGCRWSAFA